jgi:Ser/Thr protein kinase RdoA (MazF antagonist)
MTDADTLLSICRRLIDPAAKPAAVHQGHNDTIALRAATTLGQVIVKLHRGLDRHQQELHAYQTWTPQLGERVPRLLACCDDPPAIVITALPGGPLASAGLSRCREAIAYRQAGELLRRLHDAGPPRDELDMAAWLAERSEYWLAQARTIISSKRHAEIRAHLAALIDLGPIPAVPCHLDYTPRNLLAQPSGDVAVIDFEHSRYDLAARDLVRLATRVWPARPDLKEAFLNGYGPLTPTDHHVIEHCSHFDTLTATVRMAQR